MALSTIKLMEVEKRAALDETSIIAILHKEIKGRREVIVDAKKGNRMDIIDSNNAEIAFLETFLPRQLSEEEIKTLCIEVINEVGAKSKLDMGKVMKVLVPRIDGRAQNEIISRMVALLLEDQ
jgi:uncharacterized protein YqeY